MSSKINLQTCEYACKSSIFQDNQLILFYILHIRVLFGTFFCMSVVYLCLECFDVLCYFFTKYEHADQVRDCHEHICYIRKATYKIKCLCAAKFKNAFSP